jgi:mannose-binding lectin 2
VTRRFFIASIQVYIDPKDRDEWTPCTNVSINLLDGWLHRAHIGITASTGQLADNHDILYLKTYSSAALLDLMETEESNKKNFVLEDFLPAETKLKKYVCIHSFFLRNFL